MFAIPDPNPAIFQRVVIGKNVLQVKKAFTIASIIMFFILLTLRKNRKIEEKM